VNVAHAIAHHLYAARHPETALPNLLVIDSPRKNLGQEGYDISIGDALYRLFIELSEGPLSHIQVILMDNGVPDFAAEYVARHFTLEDRLIPVSPGFGMSLTTDTPQAD
jgi:hypothetical protein